MVVIRKLGTRLLLPGNHRRFDHAVRHQVLPHPRQQAGVFGEALHQDLPRALQCRLHIGHYRVSRFRLDRFGPHIRLRFHFRYQQRIGEQCLSQ